MMKYKIMELKRLTQSKNSIRRTCPRKKTSKYRRDDMIVAPYNIGTTRYNEY